MARIDFVTGNVQQYLPQVEALAGVPDRAEAALSGRSSMNFNTAPSDDEWSPARVLQHMTYYALEDAHNLRRMVWQEAPLITMWDEDQVIREHGLARMNGTNALTALTDAIGSSVDVLKELQDAWWGRPVVHPRAGRLSIRQFVERRVIHHNDHIAQLQAIAGD
ncbi:MAG TPA: DinB family protein [Dehalococcoidia bacterium]|jgi:hypothetical protein|nr:DinB family protein [Dehalococcoidia bacterium]